MKTKILYTTSAMVLALMASRAQAETKIAPYSVVHPQVDFVGTFGLAPGTELKFGVVVNPQVGQKITVTPDNGLSGSYSGASTGNATLLGIGILDSSPTPNTASVSTVSRGSVTITGDIATLNKAGTVRLQFPETVTLSDGIECGVAEINPALDGAENEDTSDDDVLNSAREVYYGGTLTLTTNATGKHCTGSGQVTLIFDDSSVRHPDDHSNDPVDDFSLFSTEDEEEENNNNDDPNQGGGGNEDPNQGGNEDPNQGGNEEPTIPEWVYGGTMTMMDDEDIINQYGFGTSVGGGKYYTMHEAADMGDYLHLGLIMPIAVDDPSDAEQYWPAFLQTVQSGQSVPVVLLADTGQVATTGPYLDILGTGILSGSSLVIGMVDEHRIFDQEYYTELLDNGDSTYWSTEGSYTSDTVNVLSYQINNGTYQLIGVDKVDTDEFLEPLGGQRTISFSTD